MIIDCLEHAASYEGLGPRVAAGLRFLRATDLAGLKPGRHELDGAALYAMVSEYRTQPAGQGQWEAHRRYLDLQCLASGEEQMGYAPLTSLTVAQAYDPERDCLFLEGRGEYFIVRPGMFVVFLPQDAHLPGLAARAPGTVKKVVVKVMV